MRWGREELPRSTHRLILAIARISRGSGISVLVTPTSTQIFGYLQRPKICVRWGRESNSHGLAPAAFRKRYLANSVHPTTYPVNFIIIVFYKPKVKNWLGKI